MSVTDVVEWVAVGLWLVVGAALLVVLAFVVAITIRDELRSRNDR